MRIKYLLGVLVQECTEWCCIAALSLLVRTFQWVSVVLYEAFKWDVRKLPICWNPGTSLSQERCGCQGQCTADRDELFIGGHKQKWVKKQMNSWMKNRKYRTQNRKNRKNRMKQSKTRTKQGHLLWKTGLKTENGGFNTFAGVVWPGKRANRAHFSWSPTSHLGRGIQRRSPFLQHTVLKNVDALKFPQNQFRTRFTRKTGPIFGWNVDIQLEFSCWLFSPKVATR